MFNGMTDTAAADQIPDTEPAAWLRIAIPSFKVGRREPKSRNKKPNRSSIEEWQSLFKDDFRRTAKANVVLTEEERRDYNQLVNLRAALYAPIRH